MKLEKRYLAVNYIIVPKLNLLCLISFGKYLDYLTDELGVANLITSDLINMCLNRGVAIPNICVNCLRDASKSLHRISQ